jgi:hypothetical protein
MKLASEMLTRGNSEILKPLRVPRGSVREKNAVGEMASSVVESRFGFYSKYLSKS